MNHLTPYTGDPVVVIGNGPVGETASLLGPGVAKVEILAK
jgi:hypothetical protein